MLVTTTLLAILVSGASASRLRALGSQSLPEALAPIVLGQYQAVYGPPDLGPPYPIGWGFEGVKYKSCDGEEKVYTEGKTYFPSCKPKECIPEGGKSVDETLCMVRHGDGHRQDTFQLQHDYPEGCCLERRNCAPSCGPETCENWYAQHIQDTTDPLDRDDFLEMYQCGEHCPDFACKATEYGCRTKDCLKCKTFDEATGETEYDNGGREVWIPFYVEVDIQCIRTGTVQNRDGSSYDWAVFCGPHMVEFETNVWENRAVGEWDCAAVRSGRHPEGGYFNKFTNWAGSPHSCQYHQLVGCECGPLDMNGFGMGPDPAQPDKSLYRCTDDLDKAKAEPDTFKYCPIVCPEGPGDVLAEEDRQKVCDRFGDLVRMYEIRTSEEPPSGDDEESVVDKFLKDEADYQAVEAWNKLYDWEPQDDLDPGYELFFTLEVVSSEDATCPLPPGSSSDSSDSSDDELEEGALAGVIVGSVLIFLVACGFLVTYARSSGGTRDAASAEHHKEMQSHGETHVHDEDHHSN